eukprot:s169_g15.t1
MEKPRWEEHRREKIEDHTGRKSEERRSEREKVRREKMQVCKKDQISIYWYFGTFTRSLLSLFEMTLANWPPVARLLMENVTDFWVPVCLFHKLTMGFAVVGVINGVVMQETFKVAHMDDTVMVRETFGEDSGGSPGKQRAMRAHLAKMSLLFDEADTSGDGRLDLEDHQGWMEIANKPWGVMLEFKSILDDYEVKIWLAAMDLDVSDVEELFQMLDDGQEPLRAPGTPDVDGRLSAEELVRGVAKLRGAARAMDLRKIHQLNLAQHRAGIMQQLRQFWMEDHLCDVVFKGNDGTEHHAHTAVLSAASAFFRNLLGGPFLEAEKVQQKQPVEIAASKAAVSALLDYIYEGQPEIPVEVGLELLRLAEACDLPKLASEVEAGIRASLDGSVALQVLQEAHGLHSLRAACEDKVAQEFETCSKHPDFGKLTASQLARIVKREDLGVSREEAVLQGIFTWLTFSKDRHAFLGMFLQHVQFQSFSLENLFRLGRMTLSGPNADDLHREVDDALISRKRNQSPSAFQSKRRRLQHWSPCLGASTSTEASGREVLTLPCVFLHWHKGEIFAAECFNSKSSIICVKPDDPATSIQRVAGEGATVTGINDRLGSFLSPLHFAKWPDFCGRYRQSKNRPF